MAVTVEELRTEVAKLIEAGDEKALEEYVLAHYTDLPEDVQGKILLGIMSEVAEKNAAENNLLDLQEKALDAMEQLTAMKDELGKK